jgi:hypothetical protein
MIPAASMHSASRVSTSRLRSACQNRDACPGGNENPPTRVVRKRFVLPGFMAVIAAD